MSAAPPPVERLAPCPRCGHVGELRADSPCDHCRLMYRRVMDATPPRQTFPEGRGPRRR